MPNAKLEELAQIEGLSIDEMLMMATTDSVACAICTVPSCDYVCEMEPDQDQGYCEACEKNTVKSCLVLAGLI